MDTHLIGYNAESFQPRGLAIYILIASVLPMLVFSPFILGILKWPSEVTPALAITMVLMNAAPLILAFVLTAISEGKQGVKALVGRLWKRGLSIKWVLISLLVWPVVFLMINLAASALEDTALPAIFSFVGKPWTYFPNTFLAGSLIVILEEFGWRGYVLPRLQARWNALASSIILGVFWALAHLPNWFMPPGNPNRDENYWAFAVQIILASILCTWIFNNTRGNLLAVILAHTMSNSVGALIGIPDSYLTYLDWALLLVMIPIVIIFGPKELVREQPEESAAHDRPLVAAD